MFCSSLAHAEEHVNCRAAAARQQEPALALAIPISCSSQCHPTHCGTAAPVPTQPQPGQVQGAHRKILTLGSPSAEPSAPGLQPLTFATTRKDPQQVKTPSWERASYLTHTSYCSMQKLTTQSQPQVGIRGLEIRQGPSLLNASFPSNSMPIRVQENKSNKSLLQLGLVFLSTSYSQA